ncbi:thermonuclease family protein [bacterium]|nr:thermonuclease family protein [bacterium]
MKNYLKDVAVGFIVVFITTIPTFANINKVDEVLAADKIRFGEWTTMITGIRVPAVDLKWGKEAKKLATQMLAGKSVKMFTLTTDGMTSGIVRNAQGYPCATLLCGEKMDLDYAVLLLERGLARVDEKTLQKDQENYREVEKIAREKKVGIWSNE